MLAKKIALIGILAVAIFIVGCSDKKSANAPILSSVEEPSIATPLDRPGPTNDQSDVDINKRITFIGIMHRSDDINGCWFIESLSGLDFVPIFEKEPEFYDGLYLRVYGFEVPNSLADCIKSSYFSVEKYEVVKNVIEEYSQVTFTGTLLQMPDGEQCRYLVTTGDKDFIELVFPKYMVNDPAPIFKYGYDIEVRGYMNSDVNSKCIDGPVLRVVKFNYIDLPTGN
jgi:hypothetical protein